MLPFYIKNNIKIFSYFLLLLFEYVTSDENENLFNRDIGNDMKIGISDGGYKSVKLKCGANTMYVDLETEEDFEGVIYTRGSFHDKQWPCFFDPGTRRGQRSFSLKFPLDKCETKQDNNVYSNILVLQHDKDLIMPGDAAFNLECDFRKPRDITVSADLNRSRSFSDNKTVVSRITLSDADPGALEAKRNKRYVESYNSVELNPEEAKSKATPKY